MNMGALPVAREISVEEYLANPSYEHCEYVNGRPVELNVGGKPHGRIQTNCAYWLKDYFRKHGGGYAATEMHCRMRLGEQVRFRLPDVSVVLNDEHPDERYLDRAPDLAIEIRSPDDSMTNQMRKFEEYFANGARLGWLILPEEKSVIVLTPNSAPRTVTEGGVLDGGSVLPGLEIPVEELFA